MSDDQDDDVALDGGMEPEHSIEYHQAGKSANLGGDDDGDEDEPAIGIGPSGDVPKRGRVISDATRAAFAKASQSIKQQLSDDADGEFGEYDESTPSPAPAAPVATAGKQTAPVDSPAGAAAEPPAPSLAPEVRAKLEQVQSRMAELDARESAISEREQASDIAKVKGAYLEKGGRAIADMVRGWLGKDATDDDFMSEMSDLITDLSGSVLGVEVPSEIRNKIEAKRANRSIRALKDDMLASESAKAKRAEAEQQKANRGRAISALDREITNPQAQHVKAYPFLVAEDNPGEIIMEVCEAQLRKDGTQLAWEVAAKRANDYLKKKADAYIDKRRHLYSAAPANPGAPATGGNERPQGDPQGIRRSHTLTNAQASAATAPAPTEPPVGKDGKWSKEAHRAATRKKFRSAFAAQSDE